MHVCFLLLSAVAAAGDEPVVLNEIGVTLPATVANIKFKGKKDFPDKSLGYAVSYGSTMCSVTLYVYNFNTPKIPDGKDNDLVKNQLKCLHR